MKELGQGDNCSIESEPALLRESQHLNSAGTGTTRALFGVLPVSAIVPVLLAATYRHYCGTTTVLLIDNV